MSVFFERAKKIIPFFAFMLFFIGVAVSALDIYKSNISLQWSFFVVIAFFAGPLSLHLSVRRFENVSLLYGQGISYLESLKVVVYGGLANMLPLPGALIMRIGFLRQKVGFKRSLYANGIAIIIWIASACVCLVGAVFFDPMASLDSLAIMLIVISVVLYCTALFWGWVSGCAMQALSYLLYVQVLLSFINVVRLWFICAALGHIVSPVFPAAVSLGGIVALGAGVAPGGIGVSESIAAIVAHFLDQDLTLGFAMAALNRFLTWSVLVVFFAGFFGVTRHKRL